MVMRVIYIQTEVVKMTRMEMWRRLRIQKSRNIAVEALQDTRDCFSDLITGIDAELALGAKNELTEVLEDVQDILRESLPEVEADLRRFTANNKRL